MSADDDLVLWVQRIPGTSRIQHVLWPRGWGPPPKRIARRARAGDEANQQQRYEPNSPPSPGEAKAIPSTPRFRVIQGGRKT